MLPINLMNKLQEQLTLERLNEAHYRALSSAADVVNRPGARALFEKSANEEAYHARRVADYLVDRNEIPRFDTLPLIPPINGNDYSGLFRLALQREQLTTVALVELWLLGSLDMDPQTTAFLLEQDANFGFPGFLAEQTASERELQDALIKIVRLSEDGLEIFDSGLMG